MIDPTGKFAIVAGNAEALGYPIASELVRLGMRVAVLDDDSAALDAFVEQQRRAGGELHPVVTDFSDAAATQAAAEEAIGRYGPPRLLVHNSAIFRERPLSELSYLDWRRESDSILQSAFVLSKAIWPAMVQARDGSIVYVSSGSAINGFASEAAYVAGKHGQEGLMKVLALEGKEFNIAVNSITTGAPIDGPLAYTYSEAMRAVMVPPAALAPAFGFLAGADADFATGHRFNAYQISEAIRLASR